MNRRGFLGSVAAGAAAFAGATPLTAGAQETGETLVTEGWTPLNYPVHVLGMRAVNQAQKLAKRLSDDVFDRARAVVRGRSIVVLTGTRIGHGYGERVGDLVYTRTLTHLWNCGYRLESAYITDTPPSFDVRRFRHFTNCWVQGSQLHVGTFGGTEDGNRWEPRPETRNIAEAFSSVNHVGMPFLPDGLEWAAHYLDESTGFVMRALASWDLSTDEVLLRWDVLCG